MILCNYMYVYECRLPGRPGYQIHKSWSGGSCKLPNTIQGAKHPEHTQSSLLKMTSYSTV